MKKIRPLLILVFVSITLTISAQQLTKGTASYYEALKTSYQSKIDWVKSNPTEHAIAVKTGWYRTALLNVHTMENYKSLAKASSNGIYLPEQNINRSINTPLPGGGTCSEAAPFCADYVYNFACGTDEPPAETGPDYGCLGSEPNPAWYYMLVENSGDIVMSLSAINDIDFIIWGPFTDITCDYNDLSEANIVDCSYSSTNQETPEIGPNSSQGATTATAGEYYMFLITNYSNQTQDFILEQTGGTGATSQSIMQPTSITNKNTKHELEMYPNPARNTVQISGLNQEQTQFEIIDITGSTVKNLSISQKHNTIDISGLKPGIYLTKFTQNNTSTYQKLIIR